MSDQASLPTEKAQEPNEEAQQQLENKTMTPLPEELSQRVNRGVTFSENTASIEMSASQKSSVSYKDALSQPMPGLSHRQRLLWLQKRRSPGLWVRCDDCDKWRYVAHVLDRHELPAKWYCRMNGDQPESNCSVPETPITIREEEDFIHAEYSAGSVVWGRLRGWPWWPAMIDDCPDTERYYWLDGFSDIPTHYNVVFFDAHEATRAWLTPENLKPYLSSKKNMETKLLTLNNMYRKRIETAMTQAEDAARLPLSNRLAKYSFITRYKGKIVTPKKIDKEQLRRIERKMKRKYNIEYGTDSSDFDEDTPNHSPPNVYVRALNEGAERNTRKTTNKVKKDLGNGTDEAYLFANNESKEANSMAARLGKC
ncbi:hypothetical protein K1T71_004063 [Dendrolimus kikuchii]|uniref:Uncharacterized protein n=1 Tax=Dendrolimus kikuchii TaxID=765133 RepID=A0ACC1D9R1_9NEOP|nr:hypothetical protein K1T71_004063 [Dendrolimus kikuchii]